MAADYNWEGKGLYIRYSGKLIGSEVLSAALQAGGDPRFDDLQYVIVNLVDAVESTMSPEDIRTLAAYNKAMGETNPRIKNAVVSYVGDESREALAVFYALLAEELPWEVEIFKSVEAARKWVKSK